MCFGDTTGVRENLVLKPLQAHPDAVGWLSPAVFGIAYRVYPATQSSLTAAMAGGKP